MSTPEVEAKPLAAPSREPADERSTPRTDRADPGKTGAPVDRGNERGRVERFLSTPLAATLLGTGVISIASLVWQQRAAESHRQLEFAREVHAEQRRLLVEFADQMPMSITRGTELKLASVWLASHDVGDTYHGRSYGEAQKYEREALAAYSACRNADSLCAQIQAVFGSFEVAECAQALDATMDGMMAMTAAPGYEDARSGLLKLRDDADVQYQQVIAAMGRELKSHALGGHR